MHLICPRCNRKLDFAEEPPSFCAYCGQALSKPKGPTTVDFVAVEDAPPSITTTGPGAAIADAAVHEAPTAPPLHPPGPVSSADPESVGGYRLLRQLGSGGMGTVYEAEEVSSGRRVALKLIAAPFAASRDAVERFRQEGQLASRVSHPRCVFVLAAEEEAGRPYIVMELMEGSTLSDLLNRQGPLSVDDAIAKIMDVIDGLQAAHQIGVIHRDVKPSNCFLEADGRVKVGDFGLSKSLLGDAHLTRTGVFMGTPMFASPEQVRGERVDHRTDVYSVAATLYCLLTGRAPFQSTDAAVTLARIAADPSPPMRGLRPELPEALDQVVLLGLERERGKRWANLDEFREALRPFVPGQVAGGGLAARFTAYLIDMAVLSPFFAYNGIVGMQLAGRPDAFYWARLVSILTSIVFVAYFIILEGFWACSFGKRCLRLRIATAKANDPPGFGSVFRRTVFWWALNQFPSLALLFFMNPLEMGHDPYRDILVSFLPTACVIGGLGLTVCTMRTRNGYRGLHEILSGTRVIRLPDPPDRWTRSRLPLALPVEPAHGFPERLGAFTIRGVISQGPHETLLLGEDEALKRKVVLELRLRTAGQRSTSRRGLTRTSRLRWLAGGQHQDQSWEAYLAPSGCCLPDLVADGGRLTWAEARPLLEQLTGELEAACGDGTLPEIRGVDQVWVQADGTIQLLDWPLKEHKASPGPSGDALPEEEEGAGAEARAWDLLRQVAVLTLEGRPRTADQTNTLVRAPLPRHAAKLLERLLGRDQPYRQFRHLRQEWEATAMRPMKISRGRRAAHLAVLSAFLYVGIIWILFVPLAAFKIHIPTFIALQIQNEQEMLSALETLDEVNCRVNPHSLGRLQAVAQLQADRELRDQVDQQLSNLKRERDARLRIMGSLSRQVREGTKKRVEAVKVETTGSMDRFEQTSFRKWIVMNAANQNLGFPLLVLIIFLGFWPLVWIVWAFMFRGGITFPMLGLTLVRANGRRAWRVQCAWRAMLVWLPFLALLAASAWMESDFLASFDGTDSLDWMAWLSWGLWWLATLLLPAYWLIALWNPERSWHDRLAGTYLVPK